jgi:transposase
MKCNKCGIVEDRDIVAVLNLMIQSLEVTLNEANFRSFALEAITVR